MVSERSLSIRELCEKLNATVPHGREDRIIRGMSTLDKATESDIAFIQKEKYLPDAMKSRAGAVLVRKGTKLDIPQAIAVDDVMASVLVVIQLLFAEEKRAGAIHPSAVIAPDARIGEGVYIGPNVVVESGVSIGAGTEIEALAFLGPGVSVGENCQIGSRVSMLEKTRIGNRVLIHPGVVIGADGFRFEVIGGRLQKIPQLGIVVVEDDVEIGANSTIDRAFLTETRIGARTKIDNLVHVGHNVTIGSDCIIVAQVGLAGSVKLGRGVMIGGQSGVKDHVTVGNGAKIAGHSAVQHDLPPGVEVLGSPAVDVKTFARYMVFYKDFSRYWKRLRTLLKEDD